MKPITSETELHYYQPALTLNALLSYRARTVIENILFSVSIILALALSFIFLADYLFSFSLIPEYVAINFNLFAGIAFIFAGLWLFFFILNAFFVAFYFRGLETILHEGGRLKNVSGITYEVAEVLALEMGDLTAQFLISDYGMQTALRSGITHNDIQTFLQGKKTRVESTAVDLSTKGFVTLEDIALLIYERDSELQNFLFSHSVDKDMFLNVVSWIVGALYKAKHADRWWGKDNLVKVKGIGRDWSYGGAYLLERYSHNILGRSTLFLIDAAYKDLLVTQLEGALSKSNNANSILVGEPGVGKMEVIRQLALDSKTGQTIDALQDKHFRVLDPDAFIARFPRKAEFEANFIKMFGQAAHAGNVILVIENIVHFLQSATQFGADVFGLMDEYLLSEDLHIVFTVHPAHFHQYVESNAQFLNHLEVIQVAGSDVEGTIRALEDAAFMYEARNKVIITYPALVAIAESADRYITRGVMPNKAIDLLVEILPVAEQKGTTIVGEELVSEYVRGKTGIPVGKITKEEKEKLLNLEAILHRRVIGQEATIDTISDAMRRARAGVQNKKKPLGSFLFLGPTGVGKTETSKALAEAFFGSEENMLRLDMSEYSSAGSIERLIGSSIDRMSGVLANMLTDKPYGVLLLDEFEKASKKVLDLFLQILDEGFFSDARGRKINARNLIIIATSNAGSDIIWRYMKEGKDLRASQSEIIDAIIERSIYKPELINRFSGVVIFHPLQEEHLEKIAQLMLERLKDRVHDKGYKLVVNDALVDLLVKKGFDKKFGARPMQRVLQDEIEEKIAQKIIKGTLKKGATVEFFAKDFA